MAPSDDSATLAVVVARLDDLRAEVRSLRDELASHRTEMVSRAEWEQRNTFVDARFRDQGREIADLRTEAAARRAPWWSVVSSVAGLIAVAVVIIQAIT